MIIRKEYFENQVRKFSNFIVHNKHMSAVINITLQEFFLLLYKEEEITINNFGRFFKKDKEFMFEETKEVKDFYLSKINEKK